MALRPTTALAVEKSVGWTKAATQKKQGCMNAIACRHKIKIKWLCTVDEHSEISTRFLEYFVTLHLFGRALHPTNNALSPLQSLCSQHT